MIFPQLDPLFRQAIEEDFGQGDLTTEAILADGEAVGLEAKQTQARVLAKEEFVLAGWPVFVRIFELIGDIEAECFFKDGAVVQPGELGHLSARPLILLSGERVALNFLQRMSGIATKTRDFVNLVAHTGAKILDTRKTTPLWRKLEKYAVRLGGGYNHRFGLNDGMLIKENHIQISGGIEKAIEACRSRGSHLHKVEVEVSDLNQLERAIGAGTDAVLLDNMTPEQILEAVKITNGRCLLEVSGGVNEDNIVQYAETKVDFISLGVLTHSYRSVDISLLL